MGENGMHGLSTMQLLCPTPIHFRQTGAMRSETSISWRDVILVHFLIAADNEAPLTCRECFGRRQSSISITSMHWIGVIEATEIASSSQKLCSTRS